jgi:hypothetical protein
VARWQEGTVSASLDLAAPKLGSGARFKKLSGALAARGASNPDALAAFIGRKKFGPKKFGKLSAGKSLANDDLGIYLAATAKDEQGMTLSCPECDYSGPASSFGADGTDTEAKPAELRTPAPSTGGVRDGVPLTVKAGNGAHALANSTRTALELAAGTVRRPVQGPMDVLPSRQPDGSSVLRHRVGGAEIARLRKTDDGKWVATVGGKDLQPRDHQRTALMEAVGTYNGAVRSAGVPQHAPLRPDPVQTPLMAEYGIPAMRAATFATPAVGASDGPRVTAAGGSGKYDPDNDGDDDSTVAGDTDKDGPGGLSPKAQAIYKKLIAKGFPPARALAFAKNSEKFAKKAAA